MEGHGYLYKTEVLFSRKKNGYWVHNQCGGHFYGTVMSLQHGPFYETRPHASSQASLSPILLSYSFHVYDNLTKIFVTVHQLISLSRIKQRCYTT